MSRLLRRVAGGEANGPRASRLVVDEEWPPPHASEWSTSVRAPMRRRGHTRTRTRSVVPWRRGMRGQCWHRDDGPPSGKDDGRRMRRPYEDKGAERRGRRKFRMSQGGLVRVSRLAGPRGDVAAWTGGRMSVL